MALIETVLVPIDFSPSSECGARIAAQLAGRLRARAILLHVAEPRPDLGEEDGYEGEESPSEAAAYGAEHLAEVAKRAGFGDAGPEQLIVEGEPAEAVCREAEQRGADLIVLATRGFGVFRRDLLGSNAAKVLHDTAIPVLTTVHCGEGARQASSIRRILCSVDLNHPVLDSLRWAQELARELGASLSALYIAPELPIEEQTRVDFQSTLLASSRRRMGEVLAEAGVEADPILEIGPLGPTLAATAERLSADLLVLGRRSGSEGRMSGHTFQILRSSPCPAISV